MGSHMREEEYEVNLLGRLCIGSKQVYPRQMRMFGCIQKYTVPNSIKAGLQIRKVSKAIFGNGSCAIFLAIRVEVHFLVILGWGHLFHYFCERPIDYMHLIWPEGPSFPDFLILVLWSLGKIYIYNYISCPEAWDIPCSVVYNQCLLWFLVIKDVLF